MRTFNKGTRSFKVNVEGGVYCGPPPFVHASLLPIASIIPFFAKFIREYFNMKYEIRDIYKKILQKNPKY